MKLYIALVLFATLLSLGKSVLYLSSPRKEYIEIAKVIEISEINGETQVLLACPHGIWAMWGKYDNIEKGQEIKVFYELTPNGVIHRVDNWHVSNKKVAH